MCDHARGHSSGRSRHAVPVSVGAGELLDATGAVCKGARNLHCFFVRPSHSMVRFAIARSRRSALLRPRMRAAGGLDRAIRDPLEGNYRRPHVNLLPTRADSAIVEFSLMVATRNPLHIARCGALESAAPGHDSFLSRFTFWSPICATTRPRSKQSERTALRP
jgi:hypothetical protein